jgi:hypothetical protein
MKTRIELLSKKLYFEKCAENKIISDEALAYSKTAIEILDWVLTDD